MEELKTYWPADEFYGIDREAIEFEWNVFSGFTTLQIFQDIQKDFKNQNVEQDQFLDRITFMSIFNDIEWVKKSIEEICISNSEQVKLCAQRFPQDHWAFIGPGKEMKWYGSRNFRPDGKWNSVAGNMLKVFHGHQTSGVPRCQGFESWDSAPDERENNHTLHW